MNSKDKIFLTIGSVAMVAAVGFGSYALLNNSTSNSNATKSATTMQSTTSSNTTTDAINSSVNSIYKDGTYTSVASYSVPHGNQNSIDVSLTIKSDVITNVSATNDYSDNESGMFIDSFESSLESKVVGKTLIGTSFSRIGGASLTTNGFQSAIESIRNEAAV